MAMSLFSPLDSQHMLVKNTEGHWMHHENVPQGGRVEIRVCGNFGGVWWYYANLVDYLRIAMALIACAIIVSDPAPGWWISVLIMGNVLLDWVDGPLARHFGQSTTIGCGMDWLADLAAQFAIALWTLQLHVPLATFFVLFTFVEIATGLFDFAVSAANIYPGQDDNSKLPLLFRVEYWLTPNHSYNRLGSACWLANTMWPLALCLRLPLFITLPLAPFALLYAWHEICQLCFVLRNWKETSGEPVNGIEFERQCSASEQTLLQEAWRQCAHAFERPKGISKIYWYNLYLNNAQTQRSAIFDEIYDFVKALLAEMYPGEIRLIVSYGFIISPANSTENQGWHYDYGPQVSTLFIPMTRTTDKNATQFIENRLKSEMPESNYFPAPAELMNDEGRVTLKVSQVISDPFVILKLYPGTCHRGIANLESYERVLFFISSNKDVFLDISEALQYAEQGDAAYRRQDA
jgi:phosphatidylglycerophosphate synthase